MSLRPRAAPAGQPAGQPTPNSRLHAVLSAGLSAGLAKGPDAPPSAVSATSASPRGRNPRVIRIDPAKGEALRRTLETGARSGRRARLRPSALADVERKVAAMLDDGVIDLGEVASLTAVIGDKMKETQASLNALDVMEDTVRDQVSALSLPSVFPPPEMPAAAATPEQRARMEERPTLTEEDEKRLIQAQEYQLQKYGFEEPPEEIESVTDDEYDELEELKERVDSLMNNTQAIKKAAYNLEVSSDMPVQTELTSEEKELKYGNAFKSAVFNLRARKLRQAQEATEEEARKIGAAARRRRVFLTKVAERLVAMLAAGGLVYQLLNTAEEEIPKPPQGWAEWFMANAPDRYQVLSWWLVE
jgi:hypothetical protein